MDAFQEFQEKARQAFLGTSDKELIEHYNGIMQELNQAMIAMKHEDGAICKDAKFRELVQVFIDQAIGTEAELVRRGLARPEELNFKAGLR